MVPQFFCLVGAASARVGRSRYFPAAISLVRRAAGESDRRAYQAVSIHLEKAGIHLTSRAASFCCWSASWRPTCFRAKHIMRFTEGRDQEIFRKCQENRIGIHDRCTRDAGRGQGGCHSGIVFETRPEEIGMKICRSRSGSGNFIRIPRSAARADGGHRAPPPATQGIGADAMVMPEA